jgi:predicted DNA-binding WGR domain protein
LLASSREAAPEQLEAARRYLLNKLIATPQAVAEDSNISREAAQAALQTLCRQGQAMYDHLAGLYRWRPLFPAALAAQVETAPDPRLQTARRLLERRAVAWTRPPQKDPPAFSSPKNYRREFFYQEGTSNKFWTITLEGDSHTVEFGRIGTRGQVQTKSFDDRPEARASYEKLIREKLAKGYREKISNEKRAADSPGATGRTRFEASVAGAREFKVRMDLDADGRVVYAECTCAEFRHNKLRQGPCPHILATAALAVEQAGQELPVSADRKSN